MARTDARAVHGFDAALDRCRDFEDAGADIIFLEAPETEDEMRPVLPGHAQAVHGEYGARRQDAGPAARRSCRRSATSSRFIR